MALAMSSKLWNTLPDFKGSVASGKFAGTTPATTMIESHRGRAVSSVVERLVYTERVGGSNPSPPNSIADLRIAICD